jgi:hypothetical protein
MGARHPFAVGTFGPPLRTHRAAQQLRLGRPAAPCGVRKALLVRPRGAAYAVSLPSPPNIPLPPPPSPVLPPPPSPAPVLPVPFPSPFLSPFQTSPSCAGATPTRS